MKAADRRRLPLGGKQSTEHSGQTLGFTEPRPQSQCTGDRQSKNWEAKGDNAGTLLKEPEMQELTQL